MDILYLELAFFSLTFISLIYGIYYTIYKHNTLIDFLTKVVFLEIFTSSNNIFNVLTVSLNIGFLLKLKYFK